MPWSKNHSPWMWLAGAVGLIGFVVTLCVVVGQFLGAKASDQLAAGAALLGGFIGAFGTAFAVYLTLASQRRDAAEKVESSLRIEVSELARLALGLRRVCEQVLTEGYRIPLRDLPALMYMPDAPVFSATVDRVSRLAYGSLLVVFHARIAEALQMVRIYGTKGTAPIPTSPGLGRIAEAQAVLASISILDKEMATTLATAWTDVCEVARTILMRDPRGPEIADASVTEVLKDLDALHASHQAHAP